MFNGFCHFGNWGSFADFGVWGWIGLILNLAFSVGLLAGLILLAVRAMRQVQDPVVTEHSTAKEILQTRYVRGEITREQYQQMLDDVR